jgi:hypothetical protein
MSATPITVNVCNGCGSDICLEVRRLGGTCRGTGAVAVPACRHISDRDGLQCLRPERVHSSGWSHAFVGESQRKPEPIYGQWFNVADVPIPNDPDAWIVTARHYHEVDFNAMTEPARRAEGDRRDARAVYVWWPTVRSGYRSRRSRPLSARVGDGHGQRPDRTSGDGRRLLNVRDEPVRVHESNRVRRVTCRRGMRLGNA